MKTKNTVLRRMARESLNGKWGLAAGVFFIVMLISIAVNFIPKIGPIASMIITGPLALGFIIFSLSISRNHEAKMNQIFEGFNYFGKALGSYLLMTLFIFLWSFLLIIPGIIASLSYSMTFFILADDHSIGAMEAIDKSKNMMYGYKWKFFLLQLSFLGWLILCAFTLGIGLLWLIPYMQVSMAKFYDDIKGEQEIPVGSEKVTLTPDLTNHSFV